MCSWKSHRCLLFEGVLWAEHQENPFQSFHNNRDEPRNIVLPSDHDKFDDDDDYDDDDNFDNDDNYNYNHNDDDDDFATCSSLDWAYTISPSTRFRADADFPLDARQHSSSRFASFAY